MTLILRASRYTTRSSGVLHLRVGQSLYSDLAKEALHRVGSPARWIPHTQEWDFPLSPAAVVALRKAAEVLGATIEWNEADGLKEYADAYLKEAAFEHEVRIAIERIIRDDSAPLEPYVTRMVRDDGEACPPGRHQSIAYHWAQRTNGLLLAHDPGTGKTRSASDASGGWYRHGIIRPMQPAFLDDRPAIIGGVLVVAPKTVIRTWQDEVRLWQNATAVAIHGSARKKAQLAATPAHYHVINYESLKYVIHNQYDALIIDEIHRCGNNTTQTNHVLGISQRVRRKLGLSGTPISNSLESIFYPMLIIDGGKTLGPSRTAFMEKYFRSYMVGQFSKYDPIEDAPKQIAAAMAESTYFVKKEEVLDLPIKTHTPVYIEMTEEQQTYYTQIKNEAITYIQDKTVTVDQASARMMKLMQICQGFVLVDADHNARQREGRHFADVKTTALMEMLTDTYRHKKVLVWGVFTYEIDRLCAMLTAKQIPFVRVDGTITSQRERDWAQDAWNTDPNLKVFVRQVSMSEGVTLHAKDCSIPCSDCVYLGLNHRTIDWIQSQDRIHRIGQKYPCSYTYLLTETGVDRAVFQDRIAQSKDASKVYEMGKDHYLELLQRDPTKGL